MICTYAGLAFQVSSEDLGTPYLVENVDGWDEGAPVATTERDHWSGDGSVPSGERFGARTVEITGMVVSTPTVSADEALAALRRARRGVLRIGDLECVVRRVDLQAARIGDAWSFSLYLRADDPLRYGRSTVALTRGAATTLPNPGDARAFPILTVTGPVVGLSVAPRGVWTLGVTVPAGQVREVDFRDGDVWDGLVRVFRRRPARLSQSRPGASVTASWSGVESSPGVWVYGTVTARRVEAWA